MTKSIVTWLALGAVLLTLAAGALIWRGQEAAKGPAEPALAFPNLAAQGPAIARIEVEAVDGTTILIKDQADLWRVQNLAGYPAKADLVNRLFLDMAGLRLIEPRSAKPENHTAMGLVAPSQQGSGVVITMKDNQGKVLAALIQGKAKDYSASGAQAGTLFVRKVGEDQAYFARSNLQAARGAKAWVDPNIFNSYGADFTRIEVRPDRSDALVITKSADGAWSMTKPTIAAKIDTTKLNALGNALTYLAFDDVKAAEAVDMSKAPSVRFTDRRGWSIVARIRLDGETAFAIFEGALDAQARDAWIATKAPAPKDGSKPDELLGKAEAAFKADQAKQVDDVVAKVAALKPYVFKLTKTAAEAMVPSLDSLIVKEPAKPAKP